MKKLLLSVAFIAVTAITTNAQTVLSQTGNTAPTAGTIACWSSSSNLMQDNAYYRSYTMSSAINLGSIRVGVGSCAGSVPITVKLYKSTGAFPGSFSTGLTQLATATRTFTPADALKAVDVNLGSSISVASGDIIVAEVSHGTTTAGNTFFMGVVSGSETASAYIKSTGCSIATPTTFAAVQAAANGKIVIDLVEYSVASSQQFFTENFNLYPNPTNDILNISSKNGLEMKEIKITDLAGRTVKTLNNVSTINVSNLSAGTYLIDITTNEGKASSKFIKK